MAETQPSSGGSEQVCEYDFSDFFSSKVRGQRNQFWGPMPIKWVKDCLYNPKPTENLPEMVLKPAATKPTRTKGAPLPSNTVESKFKTHEDRIYYTVKSDNIAVTNYYPVTGLRICVENSRKPEKEAPRPKLLNHHDHNYYKKAMSKSHRLFRERQKNKYSSKSIFRRRNRVYRILRMAVKKYRYVKDPMWDQFKSPCWYPAPYLATPTHIDRMILATKRRLKYKVTLPRECVPRSKFEYPPFLKQ